MSILTVHSFVFVSLFLPLFSWALLSFFGRFLGWRGSHTLTIFLIFCSFMLSFWSFIKIVLTGDHVFIVLGSWFRVGDLSVDWGFVFDSLSLTMFVVVTLVSLCVHVYSTNYMLGDPGFVRFMSYISLFTFFMLFLVSADNFVQMLVGWEGVGICSYLLVSFWFTRVQALKAAIKALLFNRIGDCGLLFAMFLIFKAFRTLNFDVLFLIAPYFENKILIVNVGLSELAFSYLNVCAFFLLFGVFGKSAQIGLHCWLPDAMEGPTPVSASIHAATMVTAGVFLVLRCSFFFELCPKILIILLFFSSLTVFFGSIVGLTQFDIKKIIAYSTCSQLGYMLVACACSNYSGAFFHLVNHAFIKALLFLTAGVVISKIGGEQDIRKMGGLLTAMPLTYVFMLIGSLSLAGFPFLSGFYSKDFIIEVVSSRLVFNYFFVYWLISLSTFLTSFYSFRLVFLVFISRTNLSFISFSRVQDVSFSVAAPLLLLSFLSIFSGYFLFDLFLGTGSEFFLDIFSEKKNEYDMTLELVPTFLKVIPTFFSVVGFFFGMYFDVFFLFKPINRVICSRSVNCALNFDSFYNVNVVLPFLKFGLFFCFRLIDKYFLEFFGPKGVDFLCRQLYYGNGTLLAGRFERLIFISLYFSFLVFILCLLL